MLEFHRAHQVIRRGKRVLDLGCWPGGWLQVASKLVGPKGFVVGVDKAPIDPPLEIPNCVSFVGDLEDPALCEQVLEPFGGRKADMLLSDAAPKLTGVRAVDRANEERLLEAIETQIPLLLREGGDFLVKILEGPEAQVVDRRIRVRFKTAKTIKSKATRKGSTERFLFARGYKGEGETPQSRPDEPPPSPDS
ncbi:MAG: RlmE family RNA methyltransferase [bacterium]|nr:RlmE family RNA methyltransferase [bacterium]